MQRMAKALLGLERLPTPMHAADALAVAFCPCRRAGAAAAARRCSRSCGATGLGYS